MTGAPHLDLASQSCRFLCAFIFLYVHATVYLYICICAPMFVYVYVHQCVLHLCVHAPCAHVSLFCTSKHLCIFRSVGLCYCVAVHQSAHTSMHLYTCVCAFVSVLVSLCICICVAVHLCVYGSVLLCVLVSAFVRLRPEEVDVHFWGSSLLLEPRGPQGPEPCLGFGKSHSIQEQEHTGSDAAQVQPKKAWVQVGDSQQGRVGHFRPRCDRNLLASVARPVCE